MSTHLFTLPLHTANGSEPPHLVLSTHEAGARDKEIWAIVPASALSLHQVTLPAGLPRHGQRLQTVLQSLLEERVLDDVAQLHMALQPNWQAGQTAWVAVCNKAWLQGHIDQLRGNGHIVHRIVPEWTPFQASVTTGWGAWLQGTPEAAYLWTHDAQHAWQLPLQAGLQHWAAQLNQLASQSLEAMPANLTLMADPAVADLAQKALASLQSQTHSDVAARVQTWRVQVTQPLARYRQAADTQWDLAQFEFAAHGSARWRQSLQRTWQNLARGPEWRPVRWCAALLVASQWIGINMAAWQLNSQVAFHKAQQKNILQETFPKVPVVDAPLQMANELRQLQSSSGALSARDLEHVLQAVGGQLPAGQNISAVDYQAQGQSETKLQGLQLSGPQAQTFAQALRSQSLEANSNGAQWRITPLKEAP